MNYIDYDSAQVVKDLFNDVQTSLQNQGVEDFTLNAGDERYQILKAIAYHDIVLLSKINDAFKNTVLQTARAEYLDAIGEMYFCTRKSPHGATCVLRFSIAKPVLYASVIPAGTKVTADKKIFFATQASATIPAGETSVTTIAVSTTGGTETQKYEIGAISSIVDSCAASGVTNENVPVGADDGEPYPYDVETHKDGDDGTGDEKYRERIKLALATFSTCGAQNAYIFWAKSTNATILDVRVISDVPNVIELIVCCKGVIPSPTLLCERYEAGIEPAQEILDEVVSTCNGIEKRSLGDTVSALAPELVPYDIEIKYYTLANEYADCSKTIEGVDGALQKFIEWQDSGIGKHINPTKLEALCVHPNWKEGLTGAVRVEVIKPDHTDITERQLARFSGNLLISHEIVADY